MYLAHQKLLQSEVISHLTAHTTSGSGMAFSRHFSTGLWNHTYEKECSVLDVYFQRTANTFTHIYTNDHSKNHSHFKCNSLYQIRIRDNDPHV